METAFLKHLETVLHVNIKQYTMLSGGDSAQAYRIHGLQGDFFLKCSEKPQGQAMLLSEIEGLRSIHNTNTIAVPEVLAHGTFEQHAYLVLPFIENRTASSEDSALLGRQLALLHRHESESFFGFDSDNFIGSLKQRNTKHDDWRSFYIEERLLPQLRLAFENKFLGKSEIPSENQMLKTCLDHFGSPAPSLLHGDLWGGNYLIAQNGSLYLIDPAVYYGHNEVDLAMSRLFGGFSNTFYEAYHEIIPPHTNQKELVEIYQLYYLLVHLNLFGNSYRSSVVQILKKYFF